MRPRAITERAGMGTTMTAIVIRGEEAFIAQVGDSRCYRCATVDQAMTEDHWVNEQVRRGGLSEEEAKHSPFRNVITRSLGNAPNVDVDIYPLDLEAEDQFLLCSDGLSGEVEPEEMRKAMQKGSPSQAASELVDLALERGGRDNITVLILAVKEIIKGEMKSKRKGLGGLFGRG